jgi:hypothetical protein
MEQDYTVTSEAIAFNEPLALPHFDEEVTLLAARPVVPLTKIKKSGLRRPWPLGLALVAAVLMGALTATLIAYSQQDRADETVADETLATEAIESSSNFAQKDVFASALAGAEGLATDSEEPQDLAVEKPNDPETNIATVSASAPTKKIQAPEIARSASKPMKATSVSQEEDFLSEKEVRSAERREVRRHRRDSERARRDRSSDELLRIREIFEGPPRP